MGRIASERMRARYESFLDQALRIWEDTAALAAVCLQVAREHRPLSLNWRLLAVRGLGLAGR